MAEKCGFFDAVVTNNVADRVYSADDINHIFKGVLSDGVIQGYENALNVTAGSGMSVNVDTGKAICYGHWYLNDAVKNVAISTAHATLPRYSGICIRYTKSTRTVEVISVDGTPATNPVAPTLIQTDDTYEIPLCLVYVGAGVNSLSNSNIADSRAYVSGLVDPTPLNYRRLEITQTGYPDGQRYFDIPHSYNYTPNTKLQVFDNGLLCQESEYAVMVNEVEGNYMVVFNTARALNTELSFIMIN